MTACRPARAAIVLMLAAVLVGAAPVASPLPSWTTVFERDHALVGRIWDVSAATFIEPPVLVDRLLRGRFVLLGEKHDNADHHRFQAWLVSAIIAGGRRPAVAFEMLTVAQAPAVTRYLATAPADAGGLADAVDWKRSGWPDWKRYEPIADAAIGARLPIVATNFATATVSALRRDGVAALDPAFVARYGLDRSLVAETQAAMADEIKIAHCGHGNDAKIASLVAVQRARDAQIADRLAAASDPDGAVLIAGFGHVRNDRAVPVYLKVARPGATVVAVAFLEVDRESTKPADYASDFGRATLPFDYVWFTPRADETDPCEAFKESLKRLRDKPADDRGGR